jgi:hypothetical protein
MIGSRSLRRGLLCALAVVAVFAANAAAGEYNLKMRPEIGSCFRVSAHGEFRGPRCTLSEPGKGRFSWHSGPGAKAKFSGAVKEGLKLVAIGAPNGGGLTCVSSGEIEGEYTGPKNLTIKKLVLKSCRSTEGPCQNKVGSTEGEVTFEELDGALGYISHPRHLKIGWDLFPKSGSNLASFECGGEIVSGKSTGTGVSRELQGSVIAVVPQLDRMVASLMLVGEVKKGSQFPQKFEGGPGDTLVMQIGEKLPGKGKTAYRATLAGSASLHSEELLAVLGKCAGTGC